MTPIHNKDPQAMTLEQCAEWLQGQACLMFGFPTGIRQTMIDIAERITQEEEELVALRKERDSLRAKLVKKDAEFKTHTKAVGKFLRDLYHTSIDPLWDGNLTVAEITKELLEAAERNRQSLHDTISELAEVEKERDAARDSREKLYADGMIAHRWFEKHFGEGFNGRDFVAKCPMAEEQLEAARKDVERLLSTIEGLPEKMDPGASAKWKEAYATAICDVRVMFSQFAARSAQAKETKG